MLVVGALVALSTAGGPRLSAVRTAPLPVPHASAPMPGNEPPPALPAPTYPTFRMLHAIDSWDPGHRRPAGLLGGSLVASPDRHVGEPRPTQPPSRDPATRVTA